jgi:deoxyribodipyrimidine photolyase-related protein
MDKHRIFFKQNPRLGMLVSMYDKMSPEKKEQHLLNADMFMKKL